MNSSLANVMNVTNAIVSWTNNSDFCSCFFPNKVSWKFLPFALLFGLHSWIHHRQEEFARIENKELWNQLIPSICDLKEKTDNFNQSRFSGEEKFPEMGKKLLENAFFKEICEELKSQSPSSLEIPTLEGLRSHFHQILSGLRETVKTKHRISSHKTLKIANAILGAFLLGSFVSENQFFQKRCTL